LEDLSSGDYKGRHFASLSVLRKYDKEAKKKDCFLPKKLYYRLQGGVTASECEDDRSAGESPRRRRGTGPSDRAGCLSGGVFIKIRTFSDKDPRCKNVSRVLF